MIIYKITNVLNGKIYIGQTCRTLKERVAEHKRKTKTIVGAAFKKYGFENFVIQQIDAAYSLEELNKKEVMYIKRYNSLIPFGYNQCEGGGNTNGFKHKEDSKQKMSLNKKGKSSGEKNHFYN